MFQVGRLFVDQRSCDLVIRVGDAAKHAAIAGLSGMYLVYCDVSRGGGAEKMGIVAAITDGDCDNLMVGRNGVFYDRDGRDWDATITRIVDNPISTRQAFWSPYKKLAKLIESQIEKFAAAKDAASGAATAGGVTAVAATPSAAPATAAPAAAPPFDVAKYAGIFAAIGLAIGAIGAAIGATVSAVATLSWWQVPLAALGVLLTISGPSVLMAALKLRRRNLGPLLDANGWAVNAKARINIPFGRSLTQIANFPPGASRTVIDPYARRSGNRYPLLAVSLIGGIALAIWAASARGCFDSPAIVEPEALDATTPATAPAAAPVAAPG